METDPGRRMVHFATVHWKDERWIDIQLRYLASHVGRDFKVWAYLNGIDPSHCSKFHYASTDPIEAHETKLNLLAEAISKSAEPSDYLVFIDGDAFPIANLAPVFERNLVNFQLTAVQRMENNEEKQPHPCFCATTVGFWNSIGGDWHRGHSWLDKRGDPVTDVGGNLLGILESRKIPWLPMLRSNSVNLHPTMFGVYENLIYHHGAGFRPPFERIDTEGPLGAVFRLLRYAGDHIPKVVRSAVRSPFAWALDSYRVNLAKRNAPLNQQIFDRIQVDPEFYRQFVGNGK
jgi:hypothetical protein